LSNYRITTTEKRKLVDEVSQLLKILGPHFAGSVEWVNNLTLSAKRCPMMLLLVSIFLPMLVALAFVILTKNISTKANAN
jgi:hypothetical protein